MINKAVSHTQFPHVLKSTQQSSAVINHYAYNYTYFKSHIRFKRISKSQIRALSHPLSQVLQILELLKDVSAGQVQSISALLFYGIVFKDFKVVSVKCQRFHCYYAVRLNSYHWENAI